MSLYEIRAGLAQIEPFMIAGISVVTSNEQGQAAQDINTLWERFFSESVGLNIPQKLGDEIYAVYSDYQGDHTRPYRLTIGYRVPDGHNLSGYDLVRIQDGDYAIMSAAGPQPQTLLQTWEAVWSGDLDRSFGTDFEVYGPRFFQQGVNEILLHIGVRA